MSTVQVSMAGRGLSALKALAQHVGSMETLWLVVSLTLAYGIASVVYRLWFHPLSKFPGPPLLAATYVPYVYSNFLRGEWTRKMPALHRKYGPAVRIGPDHIAVDGSIAWQEVFGYRKGRQEFLRVPNLYETEQVNILTAHHDSHRRQRRQLAPAFNDSALIRQDPTVRKYVKMLLDRFEERARLDQPVNVVEWFNLTLFDITGDLLFSDSFHSLANNGTHPWIRFIVQSFRGTAMQRVYQIYPIAGLFRIMTVWSTPQTIRRYGTEKSMARLARGEEISPGQKDVTSYMLRQASHGGKAMTRAEVLSTSPTLVVAGSETTATALSGFCFYTARNPRVYAVLAEEIRSLFKTEDEITLQSAAAAEYLQAVINETLRVYPPFAELLTRLSPGDTVDGKYVPSGTRVSAYHWATFRNPEHFVDPDEFLPERWLAKGHALYDERFEADNKAIYKPFSCGPRDCLGKRLAQAEMRYIIAGLLLRFDFELSHGQDDWHDKQKTFTIWEKSPLYVRLRPRFEPES
ncbi:Isotrichodermin C-15 hydroxylase [Purpureocillium lavendulum]|uniref:Isotrichodermin C-15 hydroxylase n=1 Tax=Purpureocillium lavendulum TaxID=1247861 RepID=A0AB34FHV9_9HYPO|nr:Isotrichodermin C-15 hydroxylase [Purpureocillium lavendulum]